MEPYRKGLRPPPFLPKDSKFLINDSKLDSILIDSHNAAVEQCPGGAICLELLVLPAAERREGSGVRCSTAAFSPSGARGERQANRRAAFSRVRLSVLLGVLFFVQYQ